MIKLFKNKKINLLSLTIFLSFLSGNVFANVEDSVFELRIDMSNDYSSSIKIGSSSLIEVSGMRYLLTNFHVCSNSPYGMKINEGNIKFSVLNHKSMVSARFTVSAKDLIFDNNDDLCLIPVSIPFSILSVKSLNMASEDRTDKMSIVSPFEKNTIKQIKVLERDNPNEDFAPKRDGYKIDFPVALGMSGSPILNEKNEIVMVVWGRDEYEKKVIGLTVGLKSIKELILKAENIIASKMFDQFHSRSIASIDYSK